MEYLEREEIFEYVKNQYGTVPEYLWETSPKSAVLRHKNGKWYAVVMSVEKCKLGLEGNEFVDIMDVKCDPEMTSMIIQTFGFLPGYHMNKQHWNSVNPNGKIEDDLLKDLLDKSYNLVLGGFSRKKQSEILESAGEADGI